MFVILIRHAEALPAVVDPDRHLSPAGRQQAQRTAIYLKEKGITVQRMVHSGKTRARETAEIIRQVVNEQAGFLSREGLKPNDATQDAFDYLEQCREDVAIVSHLPFLPKLTSRLVFGREEEAQIGFVPAAAVVLSREEDGAWRIVDHIQP